MESLKSIDNFDFIKLGELNISVDTKIVILYARFMNNVEKGWTFGTHSHSFYEFHLPLSGSCNMVLQNSKNEVLEVGKILLIYPGTNHKFTSFSDDFFRLSIAFDIQHKENVLLEEDKYIFNDAQSEIISLSKYIISECTERKIGYENIVKFHIQTILTDFLRNYPEILRENSQQRNVNPSPISRALEYIRNNISFNITSDDVAKNVNLSSRQLNRIFISNLNITISKFITKERISQIKEYLKKTNLSLREIASLTGFNDEYVLCKSFKNSTGTTPGKYRSKHKRKEHYNEKFN